MMLETVSQIASANQNAALGTPGASFSGRAAATNVLNTLARAMGLNAPFGEQDEQKAIVDKVRTLEAALLANGGDQRAISAIQVLMGTYPSLDMPPAAAAELAAQLMTARQRTIDRAIHMRQYKDDADTSNGSVMNEATDFERAQADRYQRETKIIGNLILDPSGNGAKALESMRRGEASPRQIDNWFTKHYGLSGMSRYFRAD